MQRYCLLLGLGLFAVTCGTARADSIWDRRSPEMAQLFHDYRARNVGDLLTIVVLENTEFEALEKREMNKETSTGASYNINGKTASDSVSRSFALDFDGQGTSQRKFDAKNNSSIDRKFVDRMTLTVVAVYPNGVLAVEGYRQRTLNKEVRMLRVRGFVRPADIGPNNTVQSQFLGNFEVSYVGKGPESSYTNHGWWGRILNVIGLIDAVVELTMKCKLLLWSLLLLPALLPSAARADVRIKDITELEGQRSNPLTGFGLIVGLDGTGSKSAFTQRVAVDMLQRFQVATKTIGEQRGDDIFKSGNIAAVMVTTEIGPFHRRGSRIDVTVSVLDDSTSLQGGFLIMTPLRGADKVDYVVASGLIQVGGYSASVGASGGGGSTTAGLTKNHPNGGRIPGGGIVECEARGNIVCNGCVRFLLRDPDYATSKNIAKVINQFYPATALAVDAGAVQVFVPELEWHQLVEFVSNMGILKVEPDTPARVVINERTGTVVAGENVKISTVAVTHGNLSILTTVEPVVSQPQPFARGKTVVVPKSQVEVTEGNGPVRVLERTMTVGELARALNALGATPRDLIAIFQSLKEVGALHGELVAPR